MTLGIRAKLFLVSLGLILLSLSVAYFYSRAALATAAEAEVRDELDLRARLVAFEAGRDPAPSSDVAHWEELATELGQRAHARVTLMALDGKVIGDSDVVLGRIDSVENHAGRPEVIAALASGRGESTRHSATINQDLLYVAMPFSRHGRAIGVARVALPLDRVSRTIGEFDRIVALAALLALAVAVVMSTFAARLSARTARALTHTAQRMADGDLSIRTRQLGRDEFGDLGRALDRLAHNLSSKIDELSLEHERLHGILTGMHEGVLVEDRAGLIVLVNPALREMLLLGNDAEGKRLLELVRHAELKELLDAVRENRDGETREIDVGGLKPRRLMVRAARLSGEDGEVFAVFVDVTEVRRLESLRRDFVANVSHELRTPVTAIRSAAETLGIALERDPGAAPQFAEIIDRNAERLGALVEDLLDLSRIESRELKLDPQQLALDVVFAHVIGLFSERAAKRGVKVVFEGPAEPPRLVADRRAIEHVLTNLIDNAVKYCGNGAEVRVAATLHGGRVRISVSDSGPGIEPRHLERLFERFYRVDPGRSRDQGGTGLGLSIVKHLVEAMGGDVGVESEPGRGTTFWFSLKPAGE